MYLAAPVQVGSIKTYTYIHMNPTFERLDVPETCQEPYIPGMQHVYDMAAEAIDLLHKIQVSAGLPLAWPCRGHKITSLEHLPIAPLPTYSTHPSTPRASSESCRSSSSGTWRTSRP